MGRVSIHCEPGIPWQTPFAAKMQEGLERIGVYASVTPSRTRVSDIAILLGTTCWREIETAGEYLLVDRCSFGNTDEWVTLVWNGHGRRGYHATRDDGGDRWEKVGCELKPWRRDWYGKRVILCGQMESYSPEWPDLNDWYSRIKGATHFRRHPAGTNPTGLPEAKDWEQAGQVITLNSSVAVEAVMQGIPTVTMDPAAMAWDVTSHAPNVVMIPDRTPWLHWLAWTQWHHEEIRAGLPIKHIFEGFL
jgi:hypothetical protein